MAHALALVPAVRLWLLTVALMVALMVGVGGYTRLTDSGLSITYWKPVHGIIPPLNDAEWAEEFALYQATPEYQKVNKGMEMDAFQSIFWVEYWHRVLGRVIGLAFAVPMLVFWWLGRLRGPVRWHLLGLLALGGLQGFFGWYMVKSGLIERPDVSHYRLTLHLVTAFVIFSWLLGLVFYGRPMEPRVLSVGTMERLQLLKRGLKIFAWMLLGQVMFGGFVAGLNAGLAYNSFPFMDGQFYPRGADSLIPWYRNLLENTILIQFLHRWWAFAVLTMALLLNWLAGSVRVLPAVSAAASRLVWAVGVQIVLGILTLLWVVPVSLGVLHQVTALLVLAAWVAFYVAVYRNLRANALHLRGEGDMIRLKAPAPVPASA